jgi:hypothetical protein
MKTKSLLWTLALAAIITGYALAAGPGRNPDPGSGINGQIYELTQAEIDYITLMREEEKLARDVYQALAETWDCPIFANIAVSEQRHMDAVGLLITKYGLDDPIVDDTRGAFVTPEFAELYVSLTATGSASLLDALGVGLQIEELDIADLESALDEVIEAGDVEWVFENLLRGSYNHLRAFTRAIATGGESCTGMGQSTQFGRGNGQADNSVCPMCGRSGRGWGRGNGNGNGRGNGNRNGSGNGTCDGTGQTDTQQNRDGSCTAEPQGQNAR